MNTSPRWACALIALLLSSGPVPDGNGALAAEVGSWKQSCGAQNAKTGEMITVPETEVANTFDRLARTVPTDDGGWIIQYNTELMKKTGVHDKADVVKFIFYRECARAQYRTTSDVTADCVAMSRMRQDPTASRNWIQTVRTAYRTRGRTFPSGRCPKY